MTEQNEPSMEDILASIRNILSEEEASSDGKDGASDTVADKKEQKTQDDEGDQLAPAPDFLDVSFDIDDDEKTESDEKKVLTDKTDDPEPAMPVDVDQDDDILDLTTEMIVHSQAAPAQEEPVVEEEDDFKPEPVIPAEPLKEETLTDLIVENNHDDAAAIESDSLLAAPTVQAAAATLSHLKDFASDREATLGNGDLTIERIVRETLKPYLKEWLDANLPVIVERVVKKEVAHIMDRLDLK